MRDERIVKIKTSLESGGEQEAGQLIKKGSSLQKPSQKHVKMPSVSANLMLPMPIFSAPPTRPTLPLIL